MPQKITSTDRRSILKLAGAGGALLGVGTVTATTAARPQTRKDVDAIVIGAGFAGLTAARELMKRGKSVALLEARDRVGGRVKAGKIAGLSIDLGGMWIGDQHSQMVSLAEEFGVRRYISPIAGRNITEIRGASGHGDGAMPVLPDAAMAELERLVGEIDALSDTVSTAHPWETPNAAALDAMTFQTWVEQITQDADARLMLDVLASGIFASDGGAFSALFFLFYMQAGGKITSLMSLGEGAQKWLCHGGVHQIATGLAKQLGDRLLLNSPVSEIVQQDDGVEVTAATGVYRAKQVIVALSPALCARIAYSPPLPAARDKLTQRYPMGSVIKFWIAYRRPFWRDAGLNGYTFSDRSAMSMTFDATPDASGVGLMAGFFEGRSAVEWGERGADARKAFVVEELTRLYGAEAASPIDYVDNDWPAEQYSRGCYGGNASPGTLSLFGAALRAPVGRIHWSGAETSPEYPGYIEGAVRAGLRDASNVAALL